MGEEGGEFKEKDLRLVRKESQRGGEAFRKERSDNLSLDVMAEERLRGDRMIEFCQWV